MTGINKLFENLRIQREESERAKSYSQHKMVEGMEQSLLDGESIAGRVKSLIRRIEDRDADGLSLQTLNELATNHNVDLGDILLAINSSNPAQALRDLLK